MGERERPWTAYGFCEYLHGELSSLMNDLKCVNKIRVESARRK